MNSLSQESSTPGRKMKIHDLIVGDFGRVGTLRYLKAFSQFEREYIKSELDLDEFYDEHRLIRYTVIGFLRDIKSDYLPDALDRIGDNVLLGVNGGPDPLEIIPRLVRILIPYLVTAIKFGATMIRIIIPCNTLYTVAKKLNFIFRSEGSFRDFVEKEEISGEGCGYLLNYMAEVNISAPTVPETVVKEVNTPTVSKLLVVASRSAIDAYKSIVNEKYDDLTVESWLPPDVTDFQELLIRSLNGEITAPPKTALCDGKRVIAGCTDVEIPTLEDSTRIYAGKLVEEAYDLLDLTAGN